MKQYYQDSRILLELGNTLNCFDGKIKSMKFKLQSNLLWNNLLFYNYSNTLKLKSGLKIKSRHFFSSSILRIPWFHKIVSLLMLYDFKNKKYFRNVLGWNVIISHQKHIENLVHFKLSCIFCIEDFWRKFVHFRITFPLYPYFTPIQFFYFEVSYKRFYIAKQWLSVCELQTRVFPDFWFWE